jgi:hypothetical protein
MIPLRILLSEKQSRVVLNIRLFGNARWQFASKEDLDLFIENPEKYAAQYDGHCAMGVAYENGHKDIVDPEAFTIVNGKLYVNHTKYWTTEWR